MQRPLITTTDVAIIGAGPIGLELAVGLRQAGVDYVQLDAGAVGATMAWWAAGTPFFSSPERIEIAGLPLVTPNQMKATREQYLAYLRGVVLTYKLDVRTFERIVSAQRGDEGFVLRTRPSVAGVGDPAVVEPKSAEPEREIHAQRVVLVIGDMHRPRRLRIPGEDAPHVSHYFRDPHAFFGRRVLIVGGKNSAVEAGLRCYRIGADVVMSYRGERFDPKRVKYWLTPEIEWLINKGRIAWHPSTLPISIEAGQVVLADVNDPKITTTLDVDDVLLLTGYEQDGSLFDQLGVERRGENHAPVFDRGTMETNTPGVFVAGTAVAGSQLRTRVFIENAHCHVERIVRHLTGGSVAWASAGDYSSLEES